MKSHIINLLILLIQLPETHLRGVTPRDLKALTVTARRWDWKVDQESREKNYNMRFLYFPFLDISFPVVTAKD